MKIALVAGGTGLVGNQLLKLLLATNRYDKVKAITRTDIDISHPKLVQIKADYAKLESCRDDLKADDVFCCLGTTMAKARTKEKFYQVDYSFPLMLAQIAASQQAQQFLLVSALGADKHATIFYNRVKGELEEAVSKLNFSGIHIFRPSLLLGPRTESRPGEEAAKIFYRIFWFLIPGKYKAIQSEQVAKAMLYFAAQEQKGIFIHESRELQNI